MKAFIFLAIASILFASCSGSDHNIDSRFISQQCPSVPLAEALALPTGMQFVGALNNDGTVQVCDSMYTVSPSLSQKIALSKAQGTFIWGIILFILCIVGIGVGCWMGYNGPANSKVFLAVIGLGIACGMGGADVIDWAHSKQADIHKSEYAVYMQQDGNLSEFWDKNLLK